MRAVVILAFLIGVATLARAQIVQFSGAAIPPSCPASVLDTYAASPGAWTAAYSLRKLRSAYAGNAVQLENSNTATTQDVGFSGCNPASSGSFCQTATLSVGASTANVAFPAGSVIHVFNEGPSSIFWAAGNSSVTATTASSPLTFKEGVNVTVGANTNIAALVGSGYGLNGNVGAATLFLTNCGVSKVYDQSGNSNDLAPITATLADQMGYLPSCTGSLPCLFGCLTGCGLKAADSSTYKTTVVETFTVMTWGEDITTSNFNYNGVGYPNTTSSSAQDFRWGLVNAAYPDILINNINSSSNSNAEGFGGVWRGQNLTQYDYSTGGVTAWNGGTQFMNTGSGTPTYPNAVGLYVMGDAAGNGTPGMFVEALVASGTQTARNSVSANQVSYWGITTGTASSVANSNPLGDGFNWSQIQIGSFAPDPPGAGAYTVNGNAFYSESSWNSYAQWKCSNCTTSGGQLGDLWRFQNTSFDIWDGTSRSEIDGSSGGAQFNPNVTFWISYAVWVEAGTSYSTSWNITGQMHAAGTAPICCVFNINLQSDQWVINTDNTSGSGTQTTQYTSPTITRGQWYHFVFKAFVSSGGSTDTFDVWLDPVTSGTMSHVVSVSGSLFGGNAQSAFQYWKYGNYRTTGAVLPTFAIRYGNMQACSSGADCTSKYGVTDLSAQETTPLANPAHTFLLKRDLDPASNDNTPMGLEQAA